MKIPSYEEALAITEQSEAFYFQSGYISGFEYKLFNYRLASWEDFQRHNAFELRGLTFIWDGKNWIRYIALKKFFNINENISTREDLLKNKKIESVEFKEDGSLVSLIALPNGEVVPKTKMSFSNEQTDLVSVYLKNKIEIKEIISKNTDKIFIFELVSPFNKIVLKYDETELRLLQIRDASNGDFLSQEQVKYFSTRMQIKCAETFNKTLEELQNEKTSAQNIEGWVIKFSDNQMVKLKTDWYIIEHKLKEDIAKENILISLILDECIDDVLSQLQDGQEKDFINSIICKVDRVFNHRVASAEKRASEYYKGGQDRKAFAIKYSKTQDFNVIIKSCTQPFNLADGIKNNIKNETKSLEQAREFLRNIED